MSFETLGNPIPLPDYIDRDATRVEIINGALLDVREKEPHANYARVGEWIDYYLEVWEYRTGKRHSHRLWPTDATRNL